MRLLNLMKNPLFIYSTWEVCSKKVFSKGIILSVI